MSHRNRRNAFKRSANSPFDESGPNADFLRRLRWLQEHGPNIPPADLSVQIRRPAEEIRTEPEKTPMDPPEQLAPQEAPDSLAAQTEPPAEAEPAQIEAAAAEAVEAPATQTAETQTQLEPENPAPENPSPEDAPIGEPPQTEDDLEAAAIYAAQRSDRNPIVRARRVRRRPSTKPASSARHRRLCAICNHADLEAIEDAFLHWQRPGDIKHEFQLPGRLCVYRHARAFGLFEQRAKNLRFTLENVLEESSRCRVTGDTVIRAVRAYSCLDSDGHWIEPPRHLIVSRQPYEAPAKSLAAGKEITIEPEVIEKGA